MARKSLRRNPVLGLLLVVGLLAWWYLSQQSPAPASTGGGVQVFMIPAQGQAAKERLLQLINAAERRLDIAAYELEDPDLGQALRQAAGRGVAVRLYTDRDYQREARESLGAAGRGGRQGCETLEGIRVCYDDRQPFMHHKFAVVDDSGVWTGSTNLTWNAFARNDENSLWLPSATLVNAYSAEFEALWGGNKQGLGQPAPFALEGLNGTVYFSPEGGRAGRAAMLERLQNAQKEIWVAAFVFTDRTALEMLERAKRRGVQVRVVLETRNLSTSGEETLLASGIEVRQDGNRYTMHNKVMVIDQEWVVTGSYNFSTNAWQSNNENLLVLQSRELANLYRQSIESIWNAGKPLEVSGAN